jgi:hypothetical protein
MVVFVNSKLKKESIWQAFLISAYVVFGTITFLVLSIEDNKFVFYYILFPITSSFTLYFLFSQLKKK